MLRERDFENFLHNDPSITSAKAVSARMSKARSAENILNKNLDTVVSDDDVMYESLITLQAHESHSHSPMQNAVRKYYKFINQKEFPRLKNYHSPKHP